MSKDNLSSMLQYQHSVEATDLANLSIALKMYKMLQSIIMNQMDKWQQIGLVS